MADELPDAVHSFLESVIRRNLADGQIAGDPALLAAGWQRRFVADGPRVAELARLYEELGYEVLTRPILPEQIGGDCEGCRSLILAGFQMIYTRRPEDEKLDARPG